MFPSINLWTVILVSLQLKFKLCPLILSKEIVPPIHTILTSPWSLLFTFRFNSWDLILILHSSGHFTAISIDDLFVCELICSEEIIVNELSITFSSNLTLQSSLLFATSMWSCHTVVNVIFDTEVLLKSKNILPPWVIWNDFDENDLRFD